MKPLDDAEVVALAIHELMKREQERYQQRIAEQRRISNMSDADLKKLISGGKRNGAE